MNIITKLNELITKNFNKFIKNYFNNMNYIDKQGTFSNYYNFINDLDSFNDSFIKDVIKSYFEYIKLLHPLLESVLKSIVRANKIKYLS